MLAKLLKYEIQATARIFLPLYAILLSVALVNRVISSIAFIQWQAPEIITMILYITILIGMLIGTLVIMIQRFYKNLLTDEGYLMFTLPVSTWKLIMSKLIVSLVWAISSSLTAILSIIIIAASLDAVLRWPIQLYQHYHYAYSLIGISTLSLFLELCLVALVALISGILVIYASIAIGHLFNRYRGLASVGAFVALTTLAQILLGTTVSGLSRISLPQHITTPEEIYLVIPMLHGVLWFVILFTVFLAAVYFVITNYILSRRLNLE